MDPTTGILDPTIALASQSAATQKASTDKASATKGSPDMAKAREAAVEFEAVFLAQMLKPMFEDLGSEGLFGGGHAEQMNRSMLLDEYGRQLAEGGGIGLADKVMAEMIKMQESQ